MENDAVVNNDVVGTNPTTTNLPRSFTEAISAAARRKQVAEEEEPLDFGMSAGDNEKAIALIEKFRARNAEHQARKAAEEAARQAATAPTFDQLVAQGKLLPITGLEALDDEPARISDYGRQVDDACRTITIFEIYEQLPGHKYKDNRRTGNGIMISCPNPDHPDDHPSADIVYPHDNKKGEPGGLWHCHRCSEGSDKYTVAEFLYGKMNHNALRERMAKDFRGVTKPEPPVNVPATMPVAPVVVVATAPEPATPDTDNGAPEDDIVDELLYPEYDLKLVLPGGNTFLDAYCGEALKTDIPREFPLWVGLSILSVALGRNASLLHIEQPTYSNLSVCLTAQTAAGKGRATMQGLSVLRDAVPYDDTPLLSSMCPEGARIVRLPGSGEALISELDITHEIGKDKYVHFSPPALVDFEELQMLLTKAGPTSGYKDVILQFADARSYIERSSLRNGKGLVRDGFATFLTATQPERLREQFSKGDESRGLLNRFIFPFGKAVTRRAWGQPDLDWLMATMHLSVIHNWAKQGRHFTRDDWDDAARDLWIREVGARIWPDEAGPHKKLLGRLELMMLKLILLFACNECAERITEGHVQSAFALYAYMKNCQLVLAREMAATEMSEGMRALLDAVEKAEDKLKKPPTRRELNKMSAEIAAMNDEQFANTLMKCMMSKQVFHVETKSKTGKGRTGTCYTTNVNQWATHATLAVTAAPKP